MPTPRRAALVCAGLSVATLLTACSSGNDAAPPTTTTTTTTSTAAPGTVPKSFSVETPDGQVSLSLDGKLPPNWPTAFPTPPGSTPAGSGSLGGADSSVMVGVFNAPGSAEDAFTYYRTSSEVTLENAKGGGVGPAYAGRATLTGAYSGSLTVVGVGGQNMIVVVLKGAKVGTGSVPGTTAGSTPGTTRGTTPGTGASGPRA